MAGHPEWRKSKEVDSFGDATGRKTYSLTVRGRMQNSATSGDTCKATLFYQPESRANGRRFCFKLFDYGTIPVHFVEDKAQIHFKVVESGATSQRVLWVDEDQMYLADKDVDQRLRDYLSDGHVIKVAIIEGTSKWNFTISGNKFPTEDN